MRARGVTDLTRWRRCSRCRPGSSSSRTRSGTGVMRAITLYQEEPTDIPWLRPIEGVIAYVDLVERRVLHFADHGGDPIPPRHPNFGEGEWGPVRTSLQPLAITQPEGPSFRVDGAAVEWEGWSFRVGFDAREGLVLHQLGYADDGRVRPAPASSVGVGDGRAVRRPAPYALLGQLLRRGRVRPRPPGEHAHARLRLPGRDLLLRSPWPTPTASRSRSRMRLHARRGLRRSLAAHELRSGPRTCDALVAWWSPSSPRLATTTTASSGTSTRTAPSSAK